MVGDQPQRWGLAFAFKAARRRSCPLLPRAEKPQGQLRHLALEMISPDVRPQVNPPCLSPHL